MFFEIQGLDDLGIKTGGVVQDPLGKEPRMKLCACSGSTELRVLLDQGDGTPVPSEGRSSGEAVQAPSNDDNVLGSAHTALL